MAEINPHEMKCTLILREEWVGTRNPWTMSCRISSDPAAAFKATDIQKGDILKIMDKYDRTQIGEIRVGKPEEFPRLLADTLFDQLGNQKPEQRLKGLPLTLLRRPALT